MQGRRYHLFKFDPESYEEKIDLDYFSFEAVEWNMHRKNYGRFMREFLSLEDIKNKYKCTDVKIRYLWILEFLAIHGEDGEVTIDYIAEAGYYTYKTLADNLLPKMADRGLLEFTDKSYCRKESPNFPQCLNSEPNRRVTPVKPCSISSHNCIGQIVNPNINRINYYLDFYRH